VRTFNVSFRGRRAGAIGVCYPITDSVYAERYDWEAMRLMLYEGKTRSGRKYDDISRLQITEAGEAD
jgi:hypothetical protein